MKLVSLSLRNFRQHLNSQISFSQGLIGLIGANGAGKTSLIEAISFALYGAKAIRGRLEDLKNRFSPGETATEVSLLFEHDERVYRVERTPSDAELFVGGEAKAVVAGNREVTSRITQLLGMDFDEFSAAFYTEQKGLEFLSGRKGQAERERFIVRMMGYDRLERVQELLRAERGELKSEIAGRRAALGRREELQAEIETGADQLKGWEAKHTEVLALFQKADAEEAKLRKDWLEVSKRRDVFLVKSAELKSLQTSYAEKTAAIKTLEEEKRRISELVRQAMPKEAQEAADLKTVAAEREQVILKQLTALEEGSGILRADCEKLSLAWTKELARAEADLELIEQERKRTEEQKKARSKLKQKGACPTCGQPLGSALEHVQRELAQQLEELKARALRQQASLKELKAEPPAIKVKRREIVGQEEQRKELLAERESLRRLTLELERIGRLDQELAVLRHGISELDKGLAQVRREISEQKFTEDSYQALKGKYDAAKGLLEITRSNRQKLEGEIDKCKALLARARSALEELAVREGELRARAERLVLLEESDGMLTSFRKYLNASLRPRLAELASEFLSELTDGRYTTVEIGDDFSPTVMDEVGPRPIISGGEEDILNLCVRLALSQMLTERAGHAMSLLVLDEVFGSLDEGRRANVLALLERLGTRFEQIILITHLDDLKEAVRHLVYIEFDEQKGAQVEQDNRMVTEEAYNI
ncbi:MAG: SMC family ATPase [Oligoflexia bacterium]|nr:SMC family ATPase [Oligoflexia bacterium]